MSDELAWRGFVNQTTYKDVTALDGDPITFYFGVDPSADSMTVGNLAAAMMVKHFINHGHKAVLLIGGATGLIGDPDGKSEERTLKSQEEINSNKVKIVDQYRNIFKDQDFDIVDNYDWFKDMGYLQFLRDIGKHVPMRQMLGREFVQSRLGENGAGISYAEFSYSLIQGYDFLQLYRTMGVRLQLCGADQWGNCIAGVDLIRRIEGQEVNIWSMPLIVNKSTGIKFGKSELGAVWLDANKTSTFKFYQFWLNVEDQDVASLLKVYTLLTKDDIDSTTAEFDANKQSRSAQKRLAYEVTKLIHGAEQADRQSKIADSITSQSITNLSEDELSELEEELTTFTNIENSIASALTGTQLAASNTEARRLLADNAIYINGNTVERENFEESDFVNGRLFLRRGKAFKDTAIVKQN